MTKNEVKEYLLSGGAFWHWPTGIVVFYDEVYDEMSEESDTFGVSVLNINEMQPNDLWEGYHSDNDDSIDRDTCARIIAGTPGWFKTNDPMVGERVTLAKACFAEYDKRNMRYTLFNLNEIATFEEE